MSYELFVKGEPVGQVSSMGGMTELTDALAGSGDELGRFLKKGVSEKPDKVRRSIKLALDDKTLSETVVSTLKRLSQLLPDSGKVSLSSE